MIRRIATALLVTFVAASVLGVRPASADNSAGAVTWTVDHKAKTITANVRLTIYSGCGGNPYGDAKDVARACHGRGSTVTPFLANVIKHNAEDVWNKGYHYRCYRLIVIVDVRLAPRKSAVESGRLGVRMDPSGVAIRSYVDATTTDRWQSNDPADRVVPRNDGDPETTWAETPKGTNTFAHEVGHILGLSDAYQDKLDAEGNKISVPKPGAPVDLMSTDPSNISQETINRLVERNREVLTGADGAPVKLDDLVCEAQFQVKLSGTQHEYLASNIMDSRGSRQCPGTAVTGSTTQTLDVVETAPVEIRLVEGAVYSPMGYTLVPTFDVLTAYNGIGSYGRNGQAVGLFDLPVDVKVTRFRSQPASGDIPAVFDIASGACSDGGAGHKPPVDCGVRTYSAYLAMAQDATSVGVWPVGSSLPAVLHDLGYSPPKMDRLYRNCTGPQPWPGGFAEGQGVKVVGPLPKLEALQRLSLDWQNDKKPGTIEIDGQADLTDNHPGALIQDTYRWTLTFCPINREGAAAPGCA